MQESPFKREVANLSAENAEKVRARHEKWIKNAKETSIVLGGTAVIAISNLTQLSSFINSLGHTAQGDWEKAMASVGAIALAHFVSKAAKIGMKKGLPPESAIRQRMEKEEYDKKVADMDIEYTRNPKRAKRLIADARGKIVEREGADYEMKDIRKSVPPDELEDFDRSVIQHEARDTIYKYGDDPVKSKMFLDALAYRLKGERIKEEPTGSGI